MTNEEKQIRNKIKGMFDAVFEPREDFYRLGKSGQDHLLSELQDSIVDGFLALLQDFKEFRSRHGN